jgi:hypothetical protein
VTQSGGSATLARNPGHRPYIFVENGISPFQLRNPISLLGGAFHNRDTRRASLI